MEKMNIEMKVIVKWLLVNRGISLFATNQSLLTLNIKLLTNTNH
jgi:hypothetical protein